MGNETSAMIKRLQLAGGDDYEYYNSNADDPPLLFIIADYYNNNTNKSSFWHQPSAFFEQAMSSLQFESVTFFIDNYLPPLPVLIGAIGCFALIVMLVISLICHHVNVHINLLKDLERSGFQPDDEWKKSIIHRLSVWVKRRREDEASAKLYRETDSEKQLLAEKSDNARMLRRGLLESMLPINHLYRVSGRNRAASEGNINNKSPRRKIRFTKSIENGSNNNDDGDTNLAVSAVGDLVMKTITPSLILTSIAEEREQNGDSQEPLLLPEILETEAVARYRASISSAGASNIAYDPDLLRRALTLELLELHQQLRGNEERSDKYLAAPSFDDEEGSINYDSIDAVEEMKTIYELPGAEDDADCNYAASPLRLESTSDFCDSTFFPSTPVGDSSRRTSKQLRFSEEVPLLSLPSPTSPKTLPLPSLAASNYFNWPTSFGNKNSTSSSLKPARPVRPHPQQHHPRAPPLSSSSRATGASSSSTSSGNNYSATISANNILTHYAKRIGDAYCTDFF